MIVLFNFVLVYSNQQPEHKSSTRGWSWLESGREHHKDTITRKPFWYWKSHAWKVSAHPLTSPPPRKPPITMSVSLCSEREIVKAWPDLTNKLKKWRQSQQKYVFNDMIEVLGCWYIINVMFLIVFVSSLHQVVEESGDVFTECWFNSTHTHLNHHPQPIIIFFYRPMTCTPNTISLFLTSYCCLHILYFPPNNNDDAMIWRMRTPTIMWPLDLCTCIHAYEFCDQQIRYVATLAERDTQHEASSSVDSCGRSHCIRVHSRMGDVEEGMHILKICLG